MEPLAPEAILDDLARLVRHVTTPTWLFGGVGLDFYVGRWTRPHGDIDLAALAPSREDLEDELRAAGATKTVDLGWHTRWGWFDRDVGEIELDYLRPADPNTAVLIVCPNDPIGAIPGRYRMPPHDMDPNRYATLDGVRFRVCSLAGEWAGRMNGRDFIPGRPAAPKVQLDLALLRDLLDEEEMRIATAHVRPPSPLEPGDCA